MASAFIELATSGVLEVPAVPGRIIRLLRVRVSGDGIFSTQMVTDHNGAATPIGPTLYCRQTGTMMIDVCFRREHRAGARGKDVAIVTTGVGTQAVYIEYDVVA